MSTKLYVGNLPYETTESDLQTLFEGAGQVSTINIVRDRATGQARGFAFVEMGDVEGALQSDQRAGQAPVRRPQPDGERSEADGSAGQRRRRWRLRRASAPRFALVSVRSPGLCLDQPPGPQRADPGCSEVRAAGPASAVPRTAAATGAGVSCARQISPPIVYVPF